MPISSIHFRAEIGLFYNVMYSRFKIAAPVNSFTKCLCDSRLMPSPTHILTFLLLLIVFPIISVYCLIFGKTDLCNIFRKSYLGIYLCVRIVQKLSQLSIMRPQSLTKFITQYVFFFQLCLLLPHISIYLMMCGDVETNPGPLSKQDLSLCHWNLNSICASDFIKVTLLQAYLAVHDFDIICLSETFLNSEVSGDEERLELPGYAPLIRSDHPSGDKRGGVCVYYKENLPFTRRDDLECSECIVGEIKVNNSKCFITCFYRSPSQSIDDTDSFLSNFEQICSRIALESPKCSVLIGDFNAKCTNWWPEGEDNYCGTELHSLSNILGYSQLINEPTNFEPNKSPSCIDLIFSSQPNLIETGVHPSLCNQCHHQIIFAKISFKVCLPPSYEREVWHYDRANVELINRSIEMFDWENAFGNTGINDQVNVLQEVLLNILRNFIPHETIKCNYKDPPWMNKDVKKVLRRKNRLFKKYVSGGRLPQDETILRQTTDEVSKLISDTKDVYFKKLGDKLNDPQIGQKTYWSVLKRLLNKAKIPNIPPLLEDGVFETDFKKKAGLFNVFFANQCNIFDNGSTLPECIYKTDKRVSSITFSCDDILKVINGLDPNKAHGHDGISVRMIKLSSKEVVRSLTH